MPSPVFAEDEARLLISAARTPADLAAMVDRRATGLPFEQVSVKRSHLHPTRLRPALIQGTFSQVRGGAAADGPGFTLTIGLDETDTIAAARTVTQFIHTVLGKAGDGQVIDLRVCTPEQFETEALRPDFPPLASATDAAEILGVSRQRVHQSAASNTRSVTACSGGWNAREVSGCP